MAAGAVAKVVVTTRTSFKLRDPSGKSSPFVHFDNYVYSNSRESCKPRWPVAGDKVIRSSPGGGDWTLAAGATAEVVRVRRSTFELRDRWGIVSPCFVPFEGWTYSDSRCTQRSGCGGRGAYAGVDGDFPASSLTAFPPRGTRSDAGSGAEAGEDAASSARPPASEGESEEGDGDPKLLEALRVTDGVSEAIADITVQMRASARIGAREALLAKRRRLQRSSEYVDALRYVRDPARRAATPAGGLGADVAETEPTAFARGGSRAAGTPTAVARAAPPPREERPSHERGPRDADGSPAGTEATLRQLVGLGGDLRRGR